MASAPPAHPGTRVWSVALIGNPNTGKSSVFNALTGFRQRVGNYPGITVDKKTGPLLGPSGSHRIELIDLPGAYSLTVLSADDDRLAVDVLLGSQHGMARPDGVVCIVDASNLKRNLFLVSQVLELGRPVVVALTMVDVAEDRGLSIDVERLATSLGVPVIPIHAPKGRGIDALKSAIIGMADRRVDDREVPLPGCLQQEVDELRRVCGSCPVAGPAPTRVELLRTLLDTSADARPGAVPLTDLQLSRARIETAGESLCECEAKARYAWIDERLSGVMSPAPARRSRSDVIDAFLTHRLLGLVVLALIMGAVFQSIYAWAAPLMEAIDSTFGAVGAWVQGVTPAGPVQSLLVDGVLAGVGGVLIFLPQIVILYLFLAVMDDCGYMARAAFLLDRHMRRFGLSGKSFVPMLSSFACAVPGILATRSIEDRRDRLITIVTAPLMTCSARLPVYVLLIATFVPAVPLLGGLIGLQAMVLLGLYVLGVVVAVIVAFCLRGFILRGPSAPLILELPGYKWPAPRTVFYRAYEAGREFVKMAGSVIFAASIVIWALGYYPRPASIAAGFDAQRAAADQSLATTLAAAAAEYGDGATADTLLDLPPVATALADIESAWADASSEADDVEVAATPDDAIASAASIHGRAGAAALAAFNAQRTYDDELADVDKRESGAYLRQSVLGRMGHWIEPVVRPLGWDWRIGTAAIAAFPARELIVSTMATIYNLGGDETEESTALRDRLRATTWPDGRKVFNLGVALSIMVFTALCCQCVSTLAAIRRETKTWRWPVFAFTYMTGLAYFGALATYQVASLFGN